MSSCADVVEALSLSDRELGRTAEAARARVLAHHTAELRVAEFDSICQGVAAGEMNSEVA